MVFVFNFMFSKNRLWPIVFHKSNLIVLQNLMFDSASNFIFTGFRNRGADIYTSGPSKLANWLFRGFFFFYTHLVIWPWLFCFWQSSHIATDITLKIFNYYAVHTANVILWAISVHMGIPNQNWTEKWKTSVSCLTNEFLHLIQGSNFTTVHNHLFAFLINTVISSAVLSYKRSTAMKENMQQYGCAVAQFPFTPEGQDCTKMWYTSHLT